MTTFDEKFQKALAAVKAKKAAPLWSDMDTETFTALLRTRLGWLDRYLLKIGDPPLRGAGDRAIHVTFAKAPKGSSELTALNAPQSIMLSIDARGWRWDVPMMPGQVTVSQFRGRDLKLRSKTASPEKILDHITDFFQRNVTP